jgi:hypothetical protein
MNVSSLEPRRREFERVTDFLSELLGGAFLRKDNNVTPLVHLEAVMVGIGRVYRAGKTPIRPEGDWMSDEEMLKYVRAGTNARRSVIGRLDRAEEIFLGL